MKFKEFVDRINFLYKSTRYPDDKEVVVVTNDGGIGGRSCTSVKSVSQGFDWEANRINIEVEDRIHKEALSVDEAKIIEAEQAPVNKKAIKSFMESTKKFYQSPSPCDTCDVEPPAMKFICLECEYNEEEE